MPSEIPFRIDKEQHGSAGRGCLPVSACHAVWMRTHTHVQLEAQSQPTSSLSKPCASQKTHQLAAPPMEQDCAYEVFKLWFLDLPCDFSSSVPPKSPGRALLKLNLLLYFLIQLDLACRTCGETHN